MLSITTVADGRDQRDHLVSDLEMERGQRAGTGVYRAVCGELILAAPLECPPKSRCRRCMTWSATSRGHA